MQKGTSAIVPKAAGNLSASKTSIVFDELILLRECAAWAGVSSSHITYEDAQLIVDCCQKIRSEAVPEEMALSFAGTFNCDYLVSLVDERLTTLLQDSGNEVGERFVCRLRQSGPAWGHYLTAAMCRVAAECSLLEKRLLDLERMYLRAALSSGFAARSREMAGELDAAACGRIVNEANKMLLTVNIRHCPIWCAPEGEKWSAEFWEAFSQQLSSHMPVRFLFRSPTCLETSAKVLSQLSMLSAVLVNMTIEFLHVGQFIKKSPDSQQIFSLATLGCDLAETAFFKSNKDWQDSISLLKALSLQLHANNQALNSCLRELNTNANVRNAFVAGNVLHSFRLIQEMLDQLAHSITA